MSLLPVTLGVKRNIDAQGNGGSKRRALTKAQLTKTLQAALEKDAYTCRYCGFTARQYQKAIPKDWAVSDPRDAELVTSCIFCEQCFTLESVSAMGSGALVWLPEIPQSALNHITRAIYVARAHDKETPENIRLSADRAFEILFNRRGEAKRRIGTDDPAVLAAALLESLEEGAYKERAKKLEGIRLMPLDKRMLQTSSGPEADQFPRIVSYWASAKGPYGAYPPSSWSDIFSLVQGLKSSA
jgi:intracellular multiplication protein IcmJ